MDLPSSQLIDYVIDGRNRRVGNKVDGSLQKAWLYKDGLNPVTPLNGGGKLSHRFVYGATANVSAYMVKVDRRRARGDGRRAMYGGVSDYCGSVHLVIKTDTGAIGQRIDYSSFVLQGTPIRGSSLSDWPLGEPAGRSVFVA